MLKPPTTGSREGISFSVDNVTPAETPLPTVNGLEVIKPSFPAPVYHSAGMEGRDFITTINYHPLIGAVYHAFSGHYPLVLSPDIIWITIAEGIANHVNNHAETLRHEFVSHAGKQELVVEVNSLQTTEDWENAFSRFVDKVRSHTQTELASLMRCEFSTTGIVERAVQDLMVMNTFKRYFDYVLSFICGIPTIRLTGTVEDWEKILERVKRIPEEINLSWWTEELIPICEQFAAAASGNIDREHWQSICKPKDAYGGSELTGWIVRLIPYLADPLKMPTTKNPAIADHTIGIRTDEFPRGLNSTPVTMTFKRDPEEFIEIDCIAGVVGATQCPETMEIEATAGWFIQHGGALRTNIKRIMRTHGGNPPLALDHIPPLMDKFDRSYHLPGDFRMLYEEMDGCEIGTIYRFLKFGGTCRCNCTWLEKSMRGRNVVITSLLDSNC